eukprot:scaffold16309_cov64-Phaeocystis_antarctica.AAC.3
MPQALIVGGHSKCRSSDVLRCIGTAPQVLGAMNAPSLSRSYDAPVVSFSHFLPRPELMPPRFNVGAMSFLADAAGSHVISNPSPSPSFSPSPSPNPNQVARDRDAAASRRLQATRLRPHTCQLGLRSDPIPSPSNPNPKP